MTDTFTDSRTVEQIIENIIILTQKQTKQIIENIIILTQKQTDIKAATFMDSQTDR